MIIFNWKILCWFNLIFFYLDSVETKTTSLKIASEIKQNVSQYKLTKYNGPKISVAPTTSSSTNKFKVDNTKKTSKQILIKPNLNSYKFISNQLITKKLYSKKRLAASNSFKFKLDINILLGRSIKNLSKNKYKFISKATLTKYPIVSKSYKINRLNSTCSTSSSASSLSNSYNYAKILNIKGDKFKLSKTGKKLKRLNTSTTKSLQNTKLNNTLDRASNVVSKYKLVNSKTTSNLNTTSLQRIIHARLIEIFLFWNQSDRFIPF